MAKRCSKCRLEKPPAEFHRNSAVKSGLCSRCKACARAESQAWYAANRERQRLRMRAARLKRYGITEAEYDAMLARQYGLCAICSARFTETPNVDHCHDTGRVRGLLCTPCNKGLGYFKDDRPTLLAAMDYLLP